MSSPVNVGDTLAGKYQVERVLGVGGMGVVVAAKHLTLGERVAIKFLLPQALARNDVVARFLREGQAAARLRSEHVARVHDVGKLETGAPFLVMEYLDGSDLGAVIRDKGPLSIESAVDFVMQACEALAEAHAVGIIHRDLKPSNLFLIKRLDGSPSIKLIDFGISKIQLPGAEGAEGEMTATAVMMGSPLYMAPEQMASARDVDGRADIWSLGIILHTMLTGAPPFRAPSVMQVYELITQGAPPIRTLRKDVPEGLEQAILKCLQKDRRQRYGSVAELADAIAPFGPAQASFTADRIRRIVAAKTGSGSIPPPVDDAPVPVAAVTPAAATGPGSTSAATPSSKRLDGSSDGTPPPANVSNSSVSQPSGSSAAIDPAATDGPWDQKTRPPTKKSPPIALIAAGAVVLIGVPAAIFAMKGGSGSRVPTPASDTANAHTSQVATSADKPAEGASDAGAGAAGSAAPSVLPGSTATAATPAADPSATAKAGKKAAPAPAAPQPRATAKAKSPDDLFGTQK
jgi:serine/threonine-protein kinase